MSTAPCSRVGAVPPRSRAGVRLPADPHSSGHRGSIAARCLRRLVRESARPVKPIHRRLLMQVNTVLIQRGQGHGNPATVPAVCHVLRRFRRVRYAFRSQKRIVVRNISLES